jgi:hypothetical protein
MVTIRTAGGPSDPLTVEDSHFVERFYDMYNNWASEFDSALEGMNKQLQVLEIYHDDLKSDNKLKQLSGRGVYIVEQTEASDDEPGRRQVFYIANMLPVITDCDEDLAEQYEDCGNYELRNLIEEKEKQVKRKQKEILEHADCVNRIN